MAIASSAIEMRSPAVRSMSSSRPGGIGDTCSARSISSSVVSPMADTTTQTSWPGLAGFDDASRDSLDAGGIRDAGAAVLLDDESHDTSFPGPTVRGTGADSLPRGPGAPDIHGLRPPARLVQWKSDSDLRASAPSSGLVVASALLLTGCTGSEPEPAASPTPSPLCVSDAEAPAEL